MSENNEKDIQNESVLTEAKKKKSVPKMILIAIAVLLALSASVCIFAPDVAKYAVANVMEITENYDDAIEKYSELGDFMDSETKLPACRDKKGLLLLEQEKFQGAIEQFTLSGNEENLMNTYIAQGDREYKFGNYYEAISAYDKVTTTDVSDKIKEAKYMFCKNNNEYSVRGEEQYNNFITWYKELAGEGYKDSKELYEDEFRWFGEIKVADNPKNPIYGLKTIAPGNTIYFHFRLNGGEPLEEIKIMYTMLLPNGQIFAEEFDEPFTAGTTAWVSIKIPSGFSVEGPAAISFVNVDTAEVIETCSVMIEK